MTRNFGWLLLLALASAIPFPLEAGFFQVQLPLSGRHGYGAAKGMVTFSESIGQTNRDDGTTLVVEISNVPLPPGTELTVYVHEVEVGTIKLTRLRTGRLVLESSREKSAPRIKPGSFVTMKLDDGTTVIW